MIQHILRDISLLSQLRKRIHSFSQCGSLAANHKKSEIAMLGPKVKRISLEDVIDLRKIQ